jgi:hypothetical protein
VHKRARRLVAFLEDFRVAGLDQALGFVVDGAIAQRRAVIGRALEDGEVPNFLGDLG